MGRRFGRSFPVPRERPLPVIGTVSIPAPPSPPSAGTGTVKGLPIATMDSALNTVISDSGLGLGQGSQDVPVPFVVAINGRTYLEDLEFKPWKRQAFRHTTVATTRTQADTSNEPGEQSLSTASLWRRTQDSWHLGAGQVYLDRSASAEFRYRSSKGINPWTQWQLTLHHDTQLALPTTNTNLQLVTCGAYIYVGDGVNLKYSADGVTWTTVTGMPSVNISSLCSDGNSVYAAVGASGIYSTMAGASSASQYVTSAVDSTSMVRFVMGRLMVGVGKAIYNIIATGALPTALFTSNYGAAKWVDFASGTDVIYAGMNSGDQATIYAIGITSDGTTLSAPIIAGKLPTGETLTALYGYVSGIIAIGTSTGWRFGESAAGTNGSLTVGPVTTQSTPVTCFSGYDRFVFGSYENYDSGSTGLFRMDPSQFTADLVPAWASDLMASTQGAIRSVVHFLGHPVFSVSGVGVYTRSASYVPSGTFDSGFITYGLADKKMPVFVDLTYQPLVGSIMTYTSYDEEGFVLAGTTAVAGTTFNEIGVSQNLSEHIELREVLTASSGNTATPSLNRHTLRSVPAPPIPTDLFCVIQLREKYKIGDVEHYMVPSIELAYLESLCQSKQIVFYQEGNNGPYQATLEEIDWLPEQRSYKTGEFNGVAVLNLRNVI